MGKLLSRINRMLEVFVVANLAAMTFLVFLNVVLRYAMNSGITLSEELSRILFVWLTFLGSVLVLSRNEHVAMLALVDKLPPKWRSLWLLCVDAILLGISVVLMIGCWQLTLQNMNNKMPISGIPTGVNYFAACLMGGGFCLILLSRMMVRAVSLNRGEGA